MKTVEALSAAAGPSERPATLFIRTKVTEADARRFTMKLVVAMIITAAGGLLAVDSRIPLAAAGVAILACMYTHAVELQHQCLHHSAFRKAWLHRVIGVPLGLPLLVCYSHYRVRHLQHHRYLGTPQDSEFFGFDTRQRLTLWVLFRSMLDFRRFALVARDVWRSSRGTWQYGVGQIGDRARRQIMSEYRIIGVILLGAAGLCAAGAGSLLLRLWVLPLVAALPIHFLIELPEHILCDTSSTDVLENSRSITGSWFSTWFTNGNNLHVEHHAAMVVPLSRLRDRHDEVIKAGKYVEPTYLSAYRHLFRTVLTSHRGENDN